MDNVEFSMEVPLSQHDKRHPVLKKRMHSGGGFMMSRGWQGLFMASLAALAASTYGASAYAQTAASQPQASAGGGLEEIVVTARKREEALQTVPLSVTAFSGAKLDKMNITSVTALGNVVPNLSVTPGNSFVGGIEIGIRGIIEQDTILTNDSPIALYLDGVLIARNNGVPLDFVDLERVEVLRGPQGTLFGRNTTGGAVNIVTKGPANEFGISQKIDYASNNEVTTRTVIDSGEIGPYGLKAKFAWQHHQMDGWIQNTLTKNPDEWGGADDTDSLYLTVRASPTDSLDVDLHADYTSKSTVLLPYQITYMQPTGIAYFSQSSKFGGDPLVISPNYLGSRPTYPVGPRSTLESLGYSLTLNYAFNDALNLKSITAYRSMGMSTHESLSGQGNLKQFALDGTTFAPLGIVPVTPYNVLCTGQSQDSCDNQHQYQFSEEFQASGTISDFKYTAGLYYFTEHVGDYDPQTYTFVLSPAVGININADDDFVGQSTSYAAFAQGTYTPPILNENLDFTGGLRYTRDEKNVRVGIDKISLPAGYRALGHRFQALSGDFTANYHFTSDIMGYLRFANAYKAGGFNARDPGPGYQPEYANNFEGGIKSDLFDKRLRLNADVFYTDYSNKQISTFVAVAGNSTPQTITINAASATYLGGELEATILPIDHVEIDLSFGYTDPEFQQFPYQPVANGPILNIAKIAKFPYFSKESFNAGFQYTFDPMPLGDLSARVDFAYKSGEVFHPNPLQDPLNSTIASQALTDLGANITLAHVPLNYGNAELKVEVYGRNLLNQHWRTQGIDFSAFAPGGFGIDVYNRPRTIGFSLALDFKPGGEAPAAQAAYTPPPVVNPAPASLARSYVVFFDFNKSNLTADAISIVDQAAKNATPAKATVLTVTGHTDTVGSDAYNIRLSKRRAESVAAQLEKDGIPSSEIAIVAMGKRDLLVPTGDGVREPQNRRVTIVYDGGSGPNS
jgi:iron complex outermembrane receptor protein